MPNQRKTLDVGCVTKVIMFKTYQMYQTLKNISVPEKRKTVKHKGMCFNCLSNTHQISRCKSKVSCKIKGCRKRHNTILHNVSHKSPYSNADSTTVSKEPLQNIYFCNFFQ